MRTAIFRLRLVAVAFSRLAAVGWSEPISPATGELASLSDEDRSWIAAHPVIRVGHDPTFSPYAAQDAAGKIVGIDPDYLDLISRRTGLKFQNLAREDWGKTVEDFKAGRVDLLLSLNRAPEREPYLVYTQPYTQVYNVIITRSDEPNLASLADLRGHTIAIHRGSSGLRRDLDRIVPGNLVVEYDNPAECYMAVARGEVYAAVGDMANASYFIRSHRLVSLRFGSVVSASSEIYMGVRKDWPPLLRIINQALATITAEDRGRINHRWITKDTDNNQWWVRAFKVVSGIAAVAVGVFLLMAVHNRRLARELVERRRIQAELEQTRDRLLHISQEKSELMHLVAHDLRSPLGAIQLGIDLLHHHPPLSEATRERTARSITESAEMMARLINDLLSAQNVEQGRWALNFVQDDAVRLVRASMAAMYSVAEHKRITIDADLPEKPVEITTDFMALQQVVDNLLSNAVKYSPPGARVAIAVKAGDSRCRFEVRDEGPGIKLEERERIFEKFSRGSAKPTQGEKSTGLGLWIVRRFVHALHGRVWCEPGPDAVGSVFVVEVPFVPPVN
jgi:signal transduction histidine kinase